jgi:L-threonylcarbamoyladenylate synthase
MKTEIISPEQLDIALDILRNGGLVAFPTDTVYGLGSLAFNQQAIESIYTAKQRPIEKAIPILIADSEEASKVADSIPELARQLTRHFWPGALTCILPKKQTLPPAVSATATVGVRVPDLEITRALLRLAGPMAVTSANISGAQSPTTAREVYDQLQGRIPLIIDGGTTPGGISSTVVDCTGATPVILREGPVSMEQIMQCISGK